MAGCFFCDGFSSCQIKAPLILTEFSELFYRSEEHGWRRFSSHRLLDERWHGGVRIAVFFDSFTSCQIEAPLIFLEFSELFFSPIGALSKQSIERKHFQLPLAPVSSR
jgi:hypothetical protein